MTVPRDWCLVEVAPVAVVVDGGGAVTAVPRDGPLFAEAVVVVRESETGMGQPRCLAEVT